MFNMVNSPDPSFPVNICLQRITIVQKGHIFKQHQQLHYKLKTFFRARHDGACLHVLPHLILQSNHQYCCIVWKREPNRTDLQKRTYQSHMIKKFGIRTQYYISYSFQHKNFISGPEWSQIFCFQYKKLFFKYGSMFLYGLEGACREGDI